MTYHGFGEYLAQLLISWRGRSHIGHGQGVLLDLPVLFRRVLGEFRDVLSRD